MTSVMQGVLSNLRNYFFALCLRKSASAKSLTVLHSTIPSSYFLPEIQGNYLILALACDPTLTNSEQAKLSPSPLTVIFFLPSPNFNARWSPTPAELNRTQWKADKINPRGCLPHSTIYPRYLLDTPLKRWIRESSSMKENKHSIKEQEYLAKNMLILTS